MLTSVVNLVLVASTPEFAIPLLWMYWYSCYWDHARREKLNRFSLFLNSEETLREIKGMISQAGELI